VNDLDKTEITEEMLNHLVVEDALAEDFCQLSLNALSSAEKEISMKLKTVVKDKVTLVLLDSGSSHSFISSDFVKLANLPTIPVPPRKVKLADGEWLTTTTRVSNL
jgi:cellulose biosynthesis protein BcsQ